MLNVYAYCYDYLIHRDVPEHIADALANKLASLDSKPNIVWRKELLNDFVALWHMEKTSAALDIVSERLI